MFWTRIAEVKRERKELPGKKRDGRCLMTWRTAAELIEMINSKMLLVSLVNNTLQSLHSSGLSNSGFHVLNFSMRGRTSVCACSRWCTVNLKL